MGFLHDVKMNVDMSQIEEMTVERWGRETA